MSCFVSALFCLSTLACKCFTALKMPTDTAKKYFPSYASLVIHENYTECCRSCMTLVATLHWMRHFVGIILFFRMVRGKQEARGGYPSMSRGFPQDRHLYCRRKRRYRVKKSISHPYKCLCRGDRGARVVKVQRKAS